MAGVLGTGRLAQSPAAQLAQGRRVLLVQVTQPWRAGPNRGFDDRHCCHFLRRHPHLLPPAGHAGRDFIGGSCVHTQDGSPSHTTERR